MAGRDTLSFVSARSGYSAGAAAPAPHLHPPTPAASGAPGGGKARLLAGEGDSKEAIECFDKALKINPGDKEVWADKGDALLSTQQPEEAMVCYDQVLQID